MKRTFHFVKSQGAVACTLESGHVVDLPVIPGLLKHPSPAELPELLRQPAVARKYTLGALRGAAWPVLRLFPRAWLLELIPEARLPARRREALLFLLS